VNESVIGHSTTSTTPPQESVGNETSTPTAATPAPGAAWALLAAMLAALGVLHPTVGRKR